MVEATVPVDLSKFANPSDYQRQLSSDDQSDTNILALELEVAALRHHHLVPACLPVVAHNLGDAAAASPAAAGVAAAGAELQSSSSATREQSGKSLRPRIIRFTTFLPRLMKRSSDAPVPSIDAHPRWSASAKTKAEKK
mmetsp:Transcript_45750/g.106904  ORF Transcript_45750/g.106904 Transcript_45750/m.106904 type:complete len:139 (-) Transcript_45750:25-441(-)